jgi:hypothetical protein|tara:strand:+ start:7363 stop:7569 length:207 start_codon:yes stop_codon:yes gene_type:complete
MYKETKLRTIIKTVLWRLFATLNSFIILYATISQEHIWNAIFMNITGFFVYFFYERIWNAIPYGKVLK